MLRVITVFSGPQGAPWVNTLYFSGSSQAAADEAVAATGQFWGAVDALMNTAVTWSTDSEVEVVDPVTGNVTAVFVTTPVTGAGGTVTELLPRIAQAVIRWRTGVFIGGREVRGRVFVPGLSEASGTAGAVTASSLTTMQTAAATLISSLVLQTLVVYSRTHGVFHEVLTTSVWSQFAYLGSRRD